MCGIAGILGGPQADAEAITRMTRALAHRGPDDEGIWVDREGGIALGHRRLSIIDLSPAGHQPMISASGRFVLTYNGEIYNYEDMRRELADGGYRPEWRGHSDSEVLLAGFDVWGVEATLKRAAGMFAIGLWDREGRTVTLARDRLGEKPLYYGRQRQGGPFLFASELKALLRYPGFEPEVDRHALSLLVRYLAVPEPLSIYRGIAKLQPGTLLTVREGGDASTRAYWCGAGIARSGIAKPVALDARCATDELERILDRAVGRQMVSDVPLGAFLSGGIDSSAVVATMQKLSSRPVRTFTIGFAEQGYDEAPHARAVARHLGTDHSELYVSPREAMDVIPALPEMYDEPFADSSQIPTYLISRLARQQVSVALSGDGGDELFGGYERYRLTGGWWERIARIPMPLRSAAAKALTAVPHAAWTRFGNVTGQRRLGEKLHKGASMLCSESPDQLYDFMLSQWRNPAALVIGAPQSASGHWPAAPGLDGVRGVERMMAQDMLGYLTSDILAKVDRAAMAVSLETRVPLLDPEVVEFAWRLPLKFKIRGGTTKWLLRQLLFRHVPPRLIERPKMGFGVPLDAWLRGPLRDWAEALLDETRLRDEGYFHPSEIRKAWNGQLRGELNSGKLWIVLMFQSWLEHRCTLENAAASPAAALSV